MILPIATLFGRPGNPGSGGVPALTIDPVTGDIIGAGFDSPTAIQALTAEPVTEPWTGEILTDGTSGGTDPSSGAITLTRAFRNSQFQKRTNRGSFYDYADYPPPSRIDTNSRWTTHGGPVWRNNGNQQTQSNFDLWRMAGRPTAACHGGMGDATTGTPDWAATVADLINTGAAVGVAATLPSGSVVQSSPNGTTIYTGAGGTAIPGAYGAIPTGQVAVAGSASPAAWLLGAIFFGAVIWAVKQR